MAASLCQSNWGTKTNMKDFWCLFVFYNLCAVDQTLHKTTNPQLSLYAEKEACFCLVMILHFLPQSFFFFFLFFIFTWLQGWKWWNVQTFLLFVFVLFCSSSTWMQTQFHHWIKKPCSPPVYRGLFGNKTNKVNSSTVHRGRLIHDRFCIYPIVRRGWRRMNTHLCPIKSVRLQEMVIFRNLSSLWEMWCYCGWFKVRTAKTEFMFLKHEG